MCTSIRLSAMARHMVDIERGEGGHDRDDHMLVMISMYVGEAGTDNTHTHTPGKRKIEIDCLSHLFGFAVGSHH